MAVGKLRQRAEAKANPKNLLSDPLYDARAGVPLTGNVQAGKYEDRANTPKPSVPARGQITPFKLGGK